MADRSLEGGIGSPSDLWRVFRSSVVFTLGGFAYKGLALLTVPLLARLLSPEQLGLMDLAAVVGSVLALVALVGTDDAVARHEHEGASAVWSAALTVVLISSTALTAVGLLAIAGFTVVVEGEANWNIAMAAGVLYGSALSLMTVALNAVRLRGSPTAYSLTAFVTVAVQMLAALLIAWQVPSPVPWILAAWAGVSLIAAAVTLRRYLPPFQTAGFQLAARLVRYGLPLVPAAVAWTIGDAGVRGVLSQGVGLGTVGAYGISSRVVNVLALWVVGFALAWHPFLYRSAESDVPMLARRAGVRLLAALGASATVIAAAAPEVVLAVAGERYAAAAAAVPLLAAGMVAFGVFTMATAIIAVQRRTGLIALVTSAAAALQVLAATQLVPAFGIVGAAAASAAGYAIAAAGLALAGREVTRGLRAGPLLLMTVAIAAAMIALTAAVNQSLSLRASIGLAALGAIGVLLLAERRMNERTDHAMA